MCAISIREPGKFQDGNLRTLKPTLVCKDGVVLCRDVVRQVVIQDEAQESVQQRQVDLLVYLRQHGLHEYVALALARLPDVRQVVDALAPLVHEKRRRLGIGGLDPGGEEPALICFEEEELIQVLDKGVSGIKRDYGRSTRTASVIFSTGSIS